MLKLWCLLAYLALLVSAIPQLEERALPQCSAVPTVNNRLSRCATATGFCQSFLHTTTTRATVRTTITKTITKQVTDSTTTSTTTFTTTETEEAPTSTVTTSTDHVTATDTCSAISVETSSGSNMAKRAVLEPRATPSCGVKNQPIRDVSAGCSCLLFPTRTLRPKTTTFTTVTTTTETTVISDATTTTTTPLTSAATTVSDGACPTPSGCSNQGINWAYHTYQGSDDTTTYKTRNPSASGVTPDFGNFNDGTTMFYGYNAGSSENLALEHTTYIFAPQTGTYTFEFLDLDDYARVWLGDKAYQGWNDDNADIDASTNALNSPYTMNLEQGSYTAFRLIWVQGGGPGHMHFQITSPDGTIIMSSYDNGSVHPPYLVTQSCDGTTAPPFPPFGMEGPSPNCPDGCMCPVATREALTMRRRSPLESRTITMCDSDCPQCTTPTPTPSCPTDCTCPVAMADGKRLMTMKRSAFRRRTLECDADCPQCPGGGCMQCACPSDPNEGGLPMCGASCESCMPVTPTCNRANYAGLQFAVFDKSADPQSTTAPNAQGNYDAAGLLDTTATYAGNGVMQVGPFANGPGETMTTYYSDANAPSMQVLLDHQGYFVPPTDGDYTATFTDIDDVSLLWTTTSNVDNPDTSNADAFAYYDSMSEAMGGSPSAHRTQSYILNDLIGGQYYPIRIRYGAGGGGNQFTFSLSDGLIDYNNDNEVAPVFYSQGCPEDNAPALQPYMTADTNQGQQSA